MNQRQTLALGVCALAAWLGCLRPAKADFLRLLAERNDVNDAFLDTGWRVELRVNGELGKIGNVIYGLSRVDHVTIGDESIDLDGRVWTVVSLTRGDSGYFTDASGERHVGDFYGPTSYQDSQGRRYSIPWLLNIPETDENRNALVALLELRVPLTDLEYLRDLSPEGHFERRQIDSGLIELQENADLIALFGMGNSQDFWFMEPVASGSGVVREIFGLSLLSTGPGVDAEWFRRLFNEPNQRIQLSNFEFALRDLRKTSFEAVREGEIAGRLWPYGEAETLLNVVPEPTSIVALASLGAIGGLIFAGDRLRRRRRREHATVSTKGG